MIEVPMPSGVLLSIQVSNFMTAKALFQAVLKELRGVPMTLETANEEILKNLFSSALSSPEVDKCLWACLNNCLYPDDKGTLVRVGPSTFDPEAARPDYLPAVVACAKENILPFLKGLTQEWSALAAQVNALPSLRPKMNPPSSSSESAAPGTEASTK